MKQIIKIFFLQFHFSFILSLGMASTASAQEPTDCQSCHGDKKLVVADSAGVERSLFVDVEKMANSIHAGFDCVTCHADVKEISHADQLALASCQNCHEVAATELTEGVHGKASDDDAPTCGNCHGSHEIRATADSLSLVHPRQLAFTCGYCHANPALVEKHKIPIKDPLKAYTHSIHGRLAFAGVDSAATCSSCHGIHNILPSNDSHSMTHPANLANTCGQCHPNAGENYDESEAGLLDRWSVGLMDY